VRGFGPLLILFVHFGLALSSCRPRSPIPFLLGRAERFSVSTCSCFPSSFSAWSAERAVRSSLGLPRASVDSSPNSFSSSARAQFSHLGICPAGSAPADFFLKVVSFSRQGPVCCACSRSFFFLHRQRMFLVRLGLQLPPQYSSVFAPKVSAAAFAKSTAQFHLRLNFLLLRSEANASCSPRVCLFESRSCS
jgi:hypothetical protein